MAQNKFVIIRSNDESIEVKLNGKDVAYANHDEYGWSGMNLLDEAIHEIASILKIKVVEE